MFNVNNFLRKEKVIEIRGCLNFVFEAEKARFFVQIDAFLSAIVELRLEKKEKIWAKKMLFLSQRIKFKQPLRHEEKLRAKSFLNT